MLLAARSDPAVSVERPLLVAIATKKGRSSTWRADVRFMTFF